MHVYTMRKSWGMQLHCISWRRISKCEVLEEAGDSQLRRTVKTPTQIINKKFISIEIKFGLPLRRLK